MPLRDQRWSQAPLDGVAEAKRYWVTTLVTPQTLQFTAYGSSHTRDRTDRVVAPCGFSLLGLRLQLRTG